MANTPYMIINNPVYVYDSDSSRSKIINALPIGTRIDTAYEKNGWLKLLTSGWILKTPDVILDQDKFNSTFIDSTAEANRISMYRQSRWMISTTNSPDYMLKDGYSSNYKPATEDTYQPEASGGTANSVAGMEREIATQAAATAPTSLEEKPIEIENSEEGKSMLASINDFISGKNPNTVKIGYYNIEGMRGVFGMPYQFDWTTDIRVQTKGNTVQVPRIGSDFAKDNSLFGKEYLEKIATRSPILILQAGNPSFLDELNDKDKDDISAALAAGISNLGSDMDKRIKKIVNGSGKYYNFKQDLIAYYNIVNDMCRSMASLLKIQSVKLDGVALEKYMWQDSKIGINKSSYSGAVAFYVNSEARVGESFSNGTRESSLKGMVNQVSDMASEVQFLMGASGKSFGLEGVGDKLGIAPNQDTVTKKEGAAGDSNGLVGTLVNNIDTMISGGKMIFPEIWADSQFTKSYNVSIKLDSPDCDTLSIYLNILVPLAHIIAMVGARKAGDNAYVAPFIVRAYYKSMFHIDMGLITDCSIEKGDVQAWNQDGLPTQITVNLTIKDLYNVFSLAAGTGWNDALSNPAELDYLANLCGINIEYPDFRRQLYLWKAIRNPLTAITDQIGKANMFITQKITTTWANAFNYWKQ